ncbi:MAG: DNA polymerase III subunit beta, partial [Acidimicrobiales bacterium]
MKLRCERDVLVETLSSASRAVAGRTGALPVLLGVRIQVVGDVLRVTGTDLDLTITSETVVGTGEDGVVVVPGRLITDVVRSLEPGAVTLDGDDSELRITGGRSSFGIRVLPAGDYPRVSTHDEPGVTLHAEGLAVALRQVVRAASSEEARPILTGVLLVAEGSGMRMVATDSYRLAVRDLPGVGVLPEGGKVLVPSRALMELQRLLGESEEVEVSLSTNEATFKVGSVALTTRLIEGEFPDYRSLIPASYPNQLVVGREPLLDAVRRVKLLAREPTTPVRLAVQPGRVELTVTTTDWGTATEDLDADYQGADMTVAFNPTYL